MIRETKSRRVNLLMRPSVYEKAICAANEMDISFNEYVNRLIEDDLYGNGAVIQELKVVPPMTDKNMTESLIRLILNLKNYSFRDREYWDNKTRISREEVNAYYEENYAEIKRITSLSRSIVDARVNGGMNRSGLALFIYIATPIIDNEAFQLFINDLREGNIKAIRKYIINGIKSCDKFTARDTFEIVAKCWNAYVTGNELKKVIPLGRIPKIMLIE